MNVKIIKIGNSEGIVIPAKVLFKLGIVENDILDCEINEEKKQIILKGSKLRQNWRESFKKMADNNDEIITNADSLIIKNKLKGK